MVSPFLAVLEQERQRIEQLTAGWDDPTQVDWGAEHEETAMTTAEEYMTGVAPPSGPLLKCTALYSYTVSKTIQVKFFYALTTKLFCTI